MLEKGPFKGSYNRSNELTIEKAEGKLSFTSNEAGVVQSLILSAMAVESFPIMPPLLSSGSFFIKFTGKNMELRRVEMRSNEQGVKFNFPSGDDLIWLIENLASNANNAAAMAGPSKVRYVDTTPEPPQ